MAVTLFCISALQKFSGVNSGVNQKFAVNIIHCLASRDNKKPAEAGCDLHQID
jgi:hypothetical protein